MTEMLVFMAAPFSACLVLLGIHGYFGLHVLKREVIFIDIAMAQVAGFGAILALVLGYGQAGGGEHWISIGMCAAAAGLFTLTKSFSRKLPQEAVIGVVYAVATMGAVLVAARVADGAEKLHNMLDGSILWVSWWDVFHCAWVYTIVGLFHWIFRRKFIPLSFDYAGAKKSGMNVRMWDFLFYLSFGWVLVHSVEVGGILLVFAILIIPASLASLVGRSLKARILVAWTVGTLACAAALVISWKYDFPSGPVVVCLLGLALVVAAILRKVLGLGTNGRALAPSAEKVKQH